MIQNLLLKLKSSDKQEQINNAIDAYLNSDDLLIHKGFVAAIAHFRPHILKHLLSYYVDEIMTYSVSDLIKDGKSVCFEFEDQTYHLAAMVDGSPVFTKLGSTEVVEPTFSLDSKVRRLF